MNNTNKPSLNKAHAKLMRGPIQIQLDITNKCNFRCLHCYNESGGNYICNDELTDKEVYSLFKDLKTLKPYNICFCGGEPLLRYKLIAKVANSIKQYVPNLAIVTNGFLLTEDVLETLLNSGINRIQISLDGNTKETYEKLRLKEGSFDKAIQALELCIKKKSHLTELMVCFSPTLFNISEFPLVTKRVLEMGVDVIRVQPLMLSGRGKKNSDLLQPKTYQYNQLLQYIYELKGIYGDNRVDWGDPVDHVIRFRKYLSDIFTNVTIQANGNIIATPYIPISFGNIRRHSIIEYWDNGLANVWNNEILQKYATNINIITDIGKKVEGYPHLWEEPSLDLDILK